MVERFLGEIASIEEYPDSAKAEDALRAGQVEAVLVVPADFIQRMQTLDDSATVRVIIDQSNLFQATFSETSVRGPSPASTASWWRKS